MDVGVTRGRPTSGEHSATKPGMESAWGLDDSCTMLSINTGCYHYRAGTRRGSCRTGSVMCTVAYSCQT